MSSDVKNPIFLGFLHRLEHGFGFYWKSSEGVNGGPCRDRTYDQLIKSQLLYQLS